MIRFLLSRLGYGILVLWGVVTVVFFLFNLSPGDPVRNLVGENAPVEVVENIRRKLDLDLPLSRRYLIYLNHLSPLSLYAGEGEDSRIAYDPELLGGTVLFRPGNYAVVLKSPYLSRSFLSDKSVSGILAEAMPGTIVLAVVSIVLALIIGLVGGVYASLHKDTAVDRMILFVSALGMSGPSFFVAILLAWLGAVKWREEIAIPLIPLLFFGLALVIRFLLRKRGNVHPHWKIGWIGWVSVLIWIGTSFSESGFLSAQIKLPGTGLNMTGSLYSVSVWDGPYLDLSNLILPAATLMIRPLAVIVQLTRSSMLDVLSQDYIRTARAKGLSERRVVFVHGLRNALNPVVTAVSGWFASLLAGAVFVEFVFGWKGIGQQMFLAIEKQDLPVVMGGVILIASSFVVINVLVDFIYGWIDPRVRR